MQMLPCIIRLDTCYHLGIFGTHERGGGLWGGTECETVVPLDSLRRAWVRAGRNCASYPRV